MRRVNRKKRRNIIVITIASLCIIACITFMVLIFRVLDKGDGNGGLILFEIPLFIAIIAIFFIAKDQIK